MDLFQLIATFLFGVVTYYLLFVVKKPQIVTGNRYLEKFLVDHVRVVSEMYWPSFLFWEGRLQSIFGLHRNACGKLPYRREIFELEDGGEVALDFLSPESVGVNVTRTKEPLVLLLPGLTNSSQTGYVKSLALSIVSSGASLVVLNKRGLGGVELKTPKMYCGATYEDVREVIVHLKQRNGDEKLLVVGASLGGMMLCQYLLSHPKESKSHLAAVLLLSVPWNGLAGMQYIENQKLSWIINTGAAGSLKRLVKKHQKILETEKCLDLKKILSSRTVREFDSSFTVPQFGYEDVDAYYKKCTITERVSDFAIPVFSLNAKDDPMQPGKLLPLREAQTPGSNVAFIVTNRGGHLGFLEGILPTKKTFHFNERFVTSWVRAMYEYGDDLSSLYTEAT